jgi:Leucine-rich repeat (LRR) protein
MVSYIKPCDDYWIVKDEGFGNALVIRASWSNRYFDIAAKYNIKIIRLNERIGWLDSDISFLLEIPRIHGVDILSDKVTDVSPVFQLKALKTLSLYCKAKVAGDFTKFERLQSVGLDWRPAYGSLFNLSILSRINIIGFPDKDLTQWKRNRNLKELRLESNNLKSLTGLEQFQKINQLCLYKCPKLDSLDAIAPITSIQKLSLGRCPSILDISPVAKLTELKELGIEDCRDIQSLAPVAKCKKLELLQIAGNTTVLDGDFTALTKLSNLKRVLLAQRKHYSHTANELEKPTSHF